MQFKNHKVEENCCFCVCGIRYNRLILNFFYVLSIISIINNDTCLCQSKQFNKTNLYDSLKMYDNFTKVYRGDQKEVKSFEGNLEQPSFKMDAMIPSNIEEESQEPLLPLRGKTLRKGPSSPSRSSQLGKLFELLNQHSAEVLKNNNNGSKDMIDKHASIFHSLDTFDPMKEETNISDSYFDILYDLDLEIHHKDNDQSNISTCDNNINGSTSHGEIRLKNNGNHDNKR